MNDHPPVPRSFDQVTAAWLTTVLSWSYPGITATSANVDPTMEHKPNKASVHVTYDAVGTEAKLPTPFVAKGKFNGTILRGRIINFSNIDEDC